MKEYLMSDVLNGLDMLEQNEELLKWDGEKYYTDEDAPFEIKAVADYKNEKEESRRRLSAEFKKAELYFIKERRKSVEKLIEYLPLATKKHHLKWIEKDYNMHLTYCNYSRLGDSFIIDAENCTKLINSDIYEVLEKQNINANQIDKVKLSNYGLLTLVSMLMVIVRQERFCAGRIYGCIVDGTIARLLKAIKKSLSEIKEDECIYKGVY